MRYVSLFSGIEAASVAWGPLGWQAVAVSEIEPMPCSLLAERWPGVPNLGDVTKITEERIAALGPVDLVIFGSPCQDLSIAGKGAGLEGKRSGLFYDAIRIIGWLRRNNGLRFALWENVPGAFSSNAGRDFAEVVGLMAGLDAVAVPPKGWGNEGAAVGAEAMVEWSTLDAQWFNLAQRRRRVFALADFGDWTRRPPILLEPEGLRGDSAPSRGAREDVAATLTARAKGGCEGPDAARGGHLQPVAFGGGNQSGPIDVSTALTANERFDFDSETFLVEPVAVQESQSGFRETDANYGSRRHNGVLEPIAFDTTNVTSATNRSNPQPGDPCHTLAAAAHPPAIAFPDWRVRRITPREAERLQGFPDDHTLVTHKGKLTTDTPRYKALGNSMAVTVIRHIGCSIELALIYESASI